MRLTPRPPTFSASSIQQSIARADQLIREAQECGALTNESERQRFATLRSSALNDARYSLNEAGKDLIRFARQGSTLKTRHSETLGLARIEELYENVELLIDGGRHCSQRFELFAEQFPAPLQDQGTGILFHGLAATRHLLSRTRGELNWGTKQALQTSDALHLILEFANESLLPEDLRKRGWTNGVRYDDLAAAYGEDAQAPLRAPRTEGHIWRQYRIHEQAVLQMERQHNAELALPRRVIISLICESQTGKAEPSFFQSTYFIQGRGMVPLGYRSADGRRIMFSRGRIGDQVRSTLEHIAQAIVTDPPLSFDRTRFGRGRTQIH